ncbi:unnamed protein product [Rangifer tarandus platyrhynchus]|uniref:Uncharacterized protein n=1 Tax=Rangifer tarandus platyrhynchus TaxID=3082113 RepID=A0AC59ZLM2_RANTA
MNYYTVPYHIQGGPPRDLSAVGGAANTVDTGALRCKTTFLATGLMLVLLEHGESARSLPLQPPQWLKTDVQGSRPSVWKETVRLGFPGVKWKPAADRGLGRGEAVTKLRAAKNETVVFVIIILVPTKKSARLLTDN